jgi:hypothetical protein
MDRVEERRAESVERREDERYYVPCPRRKNQARIPVTLCFNCQFSTGEVFNKEFAYVEIACGFPVSHRPEKKIHRPKVKRVSRDGRKERR